MAEFFEKHGSTGMATLLATLIVGGGGWGLIGAPQQRELEHNAAVAEQHAANSEMIREELKSCLDELKTCWKDCGK